MSHFAVRTCNGRDAVSIVASRFGSSKEFTAADKLSAVHTLVNTETFEVFAYSYDQLIGYLVSMALIAAIMRAVEMPNAVLSY